MDNQEYVEKVNKCIAMIKSGSEEAILDLYELISNSIRFIAIRFLKNQFDSDDAVQDFWLNIKKYCVNCRFVTNGYRYLCKVMQNLCLTKLRKASKSRELLSSSDIELFERYGGVNELSVEQASLKNFFYLAVNKMNNLEKKVFYLWCYDEMSIREISKELQISKSSVHRIKMSVEGKIKEVLYANGWYE